MFHLQCHRVSLHKLYTLHLRFASVGLRIGLDEEDDVNKKPVLSVPQGDAPEHVKFYVPSF